MSQLVRQSVLTCRGENGISRRRSVETWVRAGFVWHIKYFSVIWKARRRKSVNLYWILVLKATISLLQTYTWNCRNGLTDWSIDWLIDRLVNCLFIYLFIYLCIGIPFFSLLMCIMCVTNITTNHSLDFVSQRFLSWKITQQGHVFPKLIDSPQKFSEVDDLRFYSTTIWRSQDSNAALQFLRSWYRNSLLYWSSSKWLSTAFIYPWMNILRSHLP